MLDQLKTFIRDHLGVPPVAALILVGGVVHIGLNWLLKKPMTSPWGFFGVLTLAVAIEGWEIWVQYRDIGLFAPGNASVLVIFGRHGLDVLAMSVVPALLVVAGIVMSRHL